MWGRIGIRKARQTLFCLGLRWLQIGTGERPSGHGLPALHDVVHPGYPSWEMMLHVF